MNGLRFAGASIAAALVLTAPPATAQFFMQSKDFTGAPVVGDEPGLGQPLPEASRDELTAGLVWNMRAALNVAALQCQFEPTLLTVPNYNAILLDHRKELKDSFDTLTKYFVRVNKGAKPGQTAFDQFSTRTYSAFATVAAQYNFCQVAAGIGRDAIFTPRGQFGDLARARTRELRNSLVPWGEQRFPRYFNASTAMPRMEPICWSKKGEWVEKKCGPQNFPAPHGGIVMAQR